VSDLGRSRWKASLPAVSGKPAVRNDREGRGNVGIIRSPVRASTLPDWESRGEQSPETTRPRMLPLPLFGSRETIGLAIF
jgi:hypothetical protein